MSYNNEGRRYGNPNQGNSGPHSAYMFGGKSYPGYWCPSETPQTRKSDTVKSLMSNSWSYHGGCTQNAGSNRGSGVGSSHSLMQNRSNVGRSTPQQAQPKAYMQVPGQGGSGEASYVPMSIPCQVRPSGSQLPQLAPMEPVSIKFTAPPGGGTNGNPITFKIDPSVYMGAQPARRF